MTTTAPQATQPKEAEERSWGNLVKHRAAIVLLVSTVAAAATAVLNVGKLWQDLRVREAELERARLEVELRQIDQRHAIRMSYINLTTGQKPKGDVQRVLRYIQGIDADANVKAWARREAEVVEKEYEQMERELEAERSSTAQLRRLLQNAELRKNDAEAQLLREQISRTQQRSARLEALVSPSVAISPEPTGRQGPRCEVRVGGHVLAIDAEDIASCQRKALRECQRLGGPCQLNVNGGGWTALPMNDSP